MGILEMDFERILGVTFLLVVLTLSCCGPGFTLTYRIMGNRICPDNRVGEIFFFIEKVKNEGLN